MPSLAEHRDHTPRPVWITVRNPLDEREYALVRLDPPLPRTAPTWSQICRGPGFLPSGVHVEQVVSESLSNTGLLAQIDPVHFCASDDAPHGISDLDDSRGVSAFGSIFGADRGSAGGAR